MKPDARAIATLATELGRLVPARAVVTDALEGYGRDESDMGVFLPDLVVFPESAEQVSAVVKACRAARVPLTPCGARSGKSGGSLPLEGGVALSLERMNRIRSISAEDLTAVVEPGVITGTLMREVEALGLFYPPDPNSLEMCTLGGNVAENAGGPRALKYGVTRDYVLGLEWVLPDGERLRVGRQTIKGVAGYDLVGLFVGSEGTLGVATEITVQLLPRPRHVRTALIHFGSVLDAARAVGKVFQGGILPRTLELLDDVTIRAIDGRGFSFPSGAGAAVLAEIDGNHEDGLFAELAQLGEICEQAGAREVLIAQDEGQREKLWAARRVASSALRQLARHKFSEDIAVPRSKIPEAIERFKALGREIGLTVATYGHAGDGNLHANILYDSVDQKPLVHDSIRRIAEIAISLGGTITGEHGVGFAKRALLPLEQSAGVISLQRRLKALFDPDGLFNPGKVLPPE